MSHVKQLSITGVNPHIMEIIEGTAILKTGDLYHIRYDTRLSELTILDEDGNNFGTFTENDKGEEHEYFEYEIQEMFEEIRLRGIQIYPEFTDAIIRRASRDGKDWFLGRFRLGDGENSWFSFAFCPDTDEFDVVRNCGWYDGEIPSHLEDAVWDKAMEMVMDYFNQQAR